jgi:uncharacterized protein (DUF111 family)
MENTGKKVSSFVKEVVARLSGDNDEATAQKVARKAMSALEGQVAALKSRLIDDEQEVEDAEEALANAIYPTTVFSNAKQYCEGIANAQAKVESAKEELQSTKDSIEFFQKLLKDNF